MLRILYCSEKLFLMTTFSSLEMVEALGNTDDYLHAGYDPNQHRVLQFLQLSNTTYPLLSIRLNIEYTYFMLLLPTHNCYQTLNATILTTTTNAASATSIITTVATTSTNSSTEATSL